MLSGSPLKEKSQLKSPSRKIFSDLNQAFSSGVMMRSKKKVAVRWSVNRDLKILDAAALKNAVTSERAWVVTATFSREKQTLRFALCKRWPKRVTTNRFSQRSRGFRCYDFV